MFPAPVPCHAARPAPALSDRWARGREDEHQAHELRGGDVVPEPSDGCDVARIGRQ